MHSELGLGLSQRKIQKLISKSRITDLRNGGQHSYVSARRLFWVIRELQAVANGRNSRRHVLIVSELPTNQKLCLVDRCSCASRQNLNAANYGVDSGEDGQRGVMLRTLSVH